MSSKGGERSTAFAGINFDTVFPGGPHTNGRSANGTMSNQESIKTSAGPVPEPPQPDSPGSGSRGLPPEDWCLPIGSSFPSAENPKYAIKAEIDDGGMGIVYEAHQGELGVVAIKVIKPRILSQSASERFLNEARAMAKVRTEPGIATIFDCDWYTDTVTGTRAPFIAMEYVPGALPITTYSNEHQLGLRARLELFQKVCEAVAAAHRADIIHRDLKPTNVMVDAQGHPKVIDFGLALVRDPAEHARKLPSERGGLFGTLEYMSPEQAAKKFDPHVLTAASDVYSLGVILYEMLMGQLPYAKHPADAVRKSDMGVPDYTEATRIIREEPPVPPHRLNRSIHPVVETILLKALEKEPGARYRTAGELSAAIAGHLRWGRKRDMAIAAPIVALTAWLAGLVAIPAFFDLTPVSEWYRTAVGVVSPAITDFKKVVLVTVDEDTDASKFGELDTEKLTGLGFGLGQRTRPLFGALFKKLARSECEAVAFDMYYEADSPDDEAILKGIAALRDRKPDPIGCVLLLPEWEDRVSMPTRVVSESRGMGTMAGAPWLKTESMGWKIESALERGKTVMPSFSLAAVAAYRHPTSEVVYRFDNQSFSVVLTAKNNTTKRSMEDERYIPVSHVVMGDAPEAQHGLRLSKDSYGPGDRVAFLGLPAFPPDKAFDDASIRADILMEKTDAQAAELCRGKVIVVANRHKDYKESLNGEEEWAPTPDGRLVPKSYGHALAIETMLRGRLTLGELDRKAEIVVTLLAAALGTLIAAWWCGSWARALLVGVISAAGMFALSLVVVRVGGLVCNPIVPSVAMWMAIALGLAAPFFVRLVSRTLLRGPA